MRKSPKFTWKWRCRQVAGVTQMTWGRTSLGTRNLRSLRARMSRSLLETLPPGDWEVQHGVQGILGSGSPSSSPRPKVGSHSFHPASSTSQALLKSVWPSLSTITKSTKMCAFTQAMQTSPGCLALSVGKVGVSAATPSMPRARPHCNCR